MAAFKPPETQICRLCLAHTRTHFSITGNGKISEMLQVLTSMKISPSDEISTVLCLKCRLNLTLAYTIQQNMLSAEERFHERLRQLTTDPLTIKEEIKIVESDSEEDSPPEVVKPDGPPESEGHKCDKCGRVYPTRQNLVRHRYCHLTKKCPTCGKEMNISNLRVHMEIHTDNPQICDLCGVTLKNKSNLRQHQFYTHNESRHKCQFCDKSFKKKTNRDAHQRKEHGGAADYVCDTCGKKFYKSGHLTTHIRMKHLKLRPFVCDVCKSGFSSKFALQTHRRQHTNETPYRCEVCGDGFRQKVSLKSHLKSKHKVVEIVTCTCNVCGKGFASTHALYTHTRIH